MKNNKSMTCHFLKKIYAFLAKLSNIKNDYRNTNKIQPYNQLDIDSLVNQINQDTTE